VEVRGTPPNPIQQMCDEILCGQYWHRGELVEAANVIYFRFGEDWHRLPLIKETSSGASSESAQVHTMSELESEVRIDDLGEHCDLSGRRLRLYSARIISEGSEGVFSLKETEPLRFATLLTIQPSTFS
jgi:hypothetical protein